MNANKIEKVRGEIDERIKELNRGREKAQDECPHNRGGYIDGVVDIYKKDGKVYMACKICGAKDMDANAPTLDEVKAAKKTMETAVNFIKMRMSDTHPKGQETLEECATFLRSARRLEKVYANLEKNTQEQKKKKNENGGGRVSLKL